MKRLFLIWLLFSIGCVYQDPPPDVVELEDRLYQSRSSISDFSYDLNSSLVLPFLTAFGRNPFASNIIDEATNMVFLLPLIPGRPESIVFQISNESESSAGITIRMNDTVIGDMDIAPGAVRVQFRIDARHWDRTLNAIRASVTDGFGSLRIDNLWLLFDDSLDPEGLEPGNRFIGLVLIPSDENWIQAIFVPSESSISFPVFLPEPFAFVHLDILPDDPDATIDMKLVTARAFLREVPLDSQIQIQAIDDWTPIRWDVTERTGRHASLEFTNRGKSAVLLRNLEIRRGF